MSQGIYISIPFCRSKCTYCNFASGVFSATQMGRYVERLCADIAASRANAQNHGALVPDSVDSIYLGGGTPSLLPPAELTRLFDVIANQFIIAAGAEVTVECAPGTLTQPILETLVSCGVNRVSLGVQSFVDKEAASVARLHTSETILGDIGRLRAVGITNINVDLIAGLPHQTAESWAYSLEQAQKTAVPHLSVYMLEVDEDSRLGRELIGGGTRYHAHFVPDDDRTAEFYEAACSQLQESGIPQYEISNFSRPGLESRHNVKYWTRLPYLGFGVDAHSMLPAGDVLKAHGVESVRLATTDSFEDFFVSPQVTAVAVTYEDALEEDFFLGLRLNRGVKLDQLFIQFDKQVPEYLPIIEELVSDGLLSRTDGTVRLTSRGRLLSNEVFQRFIKKEEIVNL
ncbi:MAG TPA: radical SAM family heme chaperone HemW [Candidatus Angelobacter sp.]